MWRSISAGSRLGNRTSMRRRSGTLRMYRFHPDGSVGVEPLICKRATMDALQANLMMFYTGITRNAGRHPGRADEGALGS